MTLKERPRTRRPARGHFRSKRKLTFSKKRVYRRRRRAALLIVCALVLFGWSGASALQGGSPSGAEDAIAVARVEVPKVTKAPEVVEEIRRTADAERADAKEPASKKEERKPDGEKKPQDRGDKKEQQASGDKKKDPAPPPPDDPTLYLTVPKLGLYDNTVRNDMSTWALDQGAIKIPSTGFPWQDNANTYIAGHRIGYAGTESYNQFYNLPSMEKGDEVILKDANGTVYKYEVTKIFAVMPNENWVTNPVAGRDMVTLQTCVASLNDWWSITPGLLSSPPGPETARLIVQADRID